MNKNNKFWAEKVRKELSFWKDLRTEFGQEIHSPTEHEFELEDQLEELENRDEYGIRRY